MALILFEGSDWTNTWSDLSDVFTGTTMGFTAGRFGGYGIGQAGTAGDGQYFYTVPSFSGTEFVVGFAFKYSSIPSQLQLCAFSVDSRTSWQCSLWLDSTGTFTVSRSGGGTAGPPAALATSSSGLTSAGNWYYVEWKVKISDSVGTTEVRLDDVQIISASSLDTKQQTATGATMVTFIGGGQSSWAQDVYFDDIYLIDTTGATHNDFLGPSRIELLAPNADVGTPTMTSTAGTLYETIDESIRDTADYISGVSGQSAQFELSNLSSIPTAIYGVYLNAVFAKTDANTYAMRMQLHSAGSAYQTTAAYSGGSTVSAKETVVNDPNGDVAWTGATINAMKLEIEVV